MTTAAGLMKFCLLLLLALLSACATNPVTGQSELMLMTESMEIDWGHKVYPGALWGEMGGGGRYRDRDLELYLSGIVSRLHGVSHRPGLPVDFVIQNSSVPNAWAIPGHVAITRGLVAGLENEAQFAFVMSHEIGHVAARHSAAQMSRQILFSAGLAAAGVALDGKRNAEWILGIGAIGGQMFLMKYSRDQEFQADELGMLYMARAGYEPGEALRAHERLEHAANDYVRQMGGMRGQEGFLDALFSTHPPTNERIGALRLKMHTALHYQRYGDGRNAPYFQNMTSRLRQVNTAYSHYDRAFMAFSNDRIAEADMHLSRAFQADWSQAPFYGLKGYIEAHKGNLYDAQKYFAKAFDLDPEYQPAYHGIGYTYFLEKNYPAAIGYMKKSLQLLPDSAASHYFAGMSYYRMKRFSEAIPHLSEFSGAHGDHPEVHGILGVCYDQTHDQESARREFKRQTEIAPQSDLGKYAARRSDEIESALAQTQKSKEQTKKTNR